MLTTAQQQLVTFAGLELIDGLWWNVYSDGTRLPLIAGGADDDDDDADKGGDDDPDADKGGDGGDDDDPDGADKLGDAGKKALDTMKQKWKSERDQRKAAAKLFEDLGYSPEEAATKLKELLGGKAKKTADDKGGDDDPVDADAIREQARREARAEAQRERALDKIEARAGRTFEIEAEDGTKTKLRFSDPEDAAVFLRDKAADFVDGDKIDTDAIDEALAELLEKKPQLAAAADGVRRKKKFDGDADGGARKSDVKKPATLGAAIEKRYAGKS